MTKKEQFERAMQICDTHNVSNKVKAEFTELLEPKKGGQAADIESIVKRDEAGNVVELQCQASMVWLPADLEYFTKDIGSKIINEAGDTLYKISRQAQKIRSEAVKTFKASKDAIVFDVLEGVISSEDGKAMIGKLSQEPDYSGVGLIAETEEV
jgi:hypothetical protein